MWKGCGVADNPAELVAFDSVVIIDLLMKRSGRYEWILPIVKRAEAGSAKVVFSSMAVAEVFKIKGESIAESRKIIAEFFGKKWVIPVAASILIGEEAAEIQRGNVIDCADAVHVATALAARAEFFLTNDGDSSVKKKRNKRPILILDNKLSRDGRMLRIMTPQQYSEHFHRIGIFAPAVEPDESRPRLIHLPADEKRAETLALPDPQSPEPKTP